MAGILVQAHHPADSGANLHSLLLDLSNKLESASKDFKWAQELERIFDNASEGEKNIDLLDVLGEAHLAEMDKHCQQQIHDKSAKAFAKKLSQHERWHLKPHKIVRKFGCKVLESQKMMEGLWRMTGIEDFEDAFAAICSKAKERRDGSFRKSGLSREPKFDPTDFRRALEEVFPHTIQPPPFDVEAKHISTHLPKTEQAFTVSKRKRQNPETENEVDPSTQSELFPASALNRIEPPPAQKLKLKSSQVGESSVMQELPREDDAEMANYGDYDASGYEQLPVGSTFVRSQGQMMHRSASRETSDGLPNETRSGNLIGEEKPVYQRQDFQIRESRPHNLQGKQDSTNERHTESLPIEARRDSLFDSEDTVLKAFEPDTWLNDLAIWHCLHAFNPDRKGILVVQPTWIDVSNPSNMSNKHHRELSNAHQILVVPINIESSHWTVGIVDLAESTAIVYDPRLPANGNEKALNALKGFLKAENAELKSRDWDVRPASAQVQLYQERNNHNDCGIYIIIFALFHMLRKADHLPKLIKPQVWRRFISAGLRHAGNNGNDSTKSLGKVLVSIDKSTPHDEAAMKSLELSRLEMESIGCCRSMAFLMDQAIEVLQAQKSKAQQLYGELMALCRSYNDKPGYNSNPLFKELKGSLDQEIARSEFVKKLTVADEREYRARSRDFLGEAQGNIDAGRSKYNTLEREREEASRQLEKLG